MANLQAALMRQRDSYRHYQDWTAEAQLAYGVGLKDGARVVLKVISDELAEGKGPLRLSSILGKLNAHLMALADPPLP